MSIIDDARTARNGTMQNFARAAGVSTITVLRALYNERIPAEFWQELRAADLLRADAPVPGGEV